MNIFDRLALEKEDDYWKTGPGYEAPKYQSAQANLYSDNARHYLAGPNKAGAEKPIQYMNGAKAPYEQGPSAEDKDTFKKAKLTRSQVFDGSGETLTETNLSEDGVETKVVKKTPSSLLDNESYDTPILGNDEVTYPSIATPPAEVVVTEQPASSMIQFAQTGGLLENTPEFAEVNKKVLTDMANSMGISLAELAQNKEFIQTFGGRYDSLINAAPEEYKGPGEIVSQVAWDDLHDGQTLGESITGDPGNREPSINGYSDYQTTFSNGLIVQDATTMVGSDDDKAYWNSETQTLDDPEGRVISRTENGDGTVTYRFNNSLGQHGQLSNEAIQEAEAKIASAKSSVVALEAALENATLPGRVISDIEVAAIAAQLDAAKEAVIEGEAELQGALVNEKDQVVLVEELEKESILDEEAQKLEEELKAKAASGDLDPNNRDSNYEYTITEAVEILKNDDPEAIAELNNFADWAETVSDEESQAAAEEYLQSLADTPTVDQRFKKAMAIAFAAMLFGDDFSTAMNTGFGVVADDYTEEKLKAQTAAEAEAALAAEIAKEQRALQNDNAKSYRDFQESVALKQMEQNAASFKDSKEANQKRLNKNVELGDSILKDLLAQNSEHENYYNLANKSVSTQMAGLLKKVEDFAPDGFVLDLRDNTQRQALGTVLSKFVNEQLHFKDGSTPALADYAEEMFTKIELEQYTDISPNLIAPSRAYLQDVRKVDMSELDSSAFHGLQYSNKEVIRLGETIQDLSLIHS
mgnify:CR=1 FL=1